MEIEWKNNFIEVKPPRTLKKITGTRFGAVLNKNPWTTPFQAWCEITKTYNLPFEDTIYTSAGKIIEPKQAEYMKKAYFMHNLVAPTDKYGVDYFKRLKGDFFPENSVFGGMWDYILTDKKGKPTAVLEMKTTKRVEDWAPDIPEYYALQAALYAYLLNVDTVHMVCSILTDKDYETPEAYVPSAKNTIIATFSLKERYPDFDKLLLKAEQFYMTCKSGVSPEFDEEKDKEYLSALRTNTLSTAPNLDELDELVFQYERKLKELKPLEKAIKERQDNLKKFCQQSFREGDTKVTLQSKNFCWTVAKTSTVDIDKIALQADGIFTKYAKEKVQFRLTKKEIK